MVSFIFRRCYSNRVISVTTIIYCYCFTSCIFNSIFGNINFVFSTCIARVLTITNSNISNISIPCCSCFFNYTFSRSCSCRASYSINSYFIDSFTCYRCIFCYMNIIAYTLNLNFMIQFSFCVIGQISYYICTRSSCFDVLTVVSTNYTKA